MDKLTLHQAIINVLNLEGKSLSAREIAQRVKYLKKNGEKPQANQISARINKYPTLFEKDKSFTPMRYYLKK